MRASKKKIRAPLAVTGLLGPLVAFVLGAASAEASPGRVVPALSAEALTQRPPSLALERALSDERTPEPSFSLFDSPTLPSGTLEVDLPSGALEGLLARLYGLAAAPTLDVEGSVVLPDPEIDDLPRQTR